MTGQPHTALDDRADDADLDRLRDAAAHFIDVVRRLVRLQLHAGVHPVDALFAGTTMLEQWEAAMTGTGPVPGETYTKQVEAVLARLYARVGAERMWEWVREPDEQLHGRTPLRALVAHDVRAVRALVDTLPETPQSGTPTGPAAS